MEIKYVLFLLPLTWAIFILIFSDTFSVLGITTNILASFIASAILTVSLSSLKVLDSGLGDSATWILFILIFGGLFYGITVGSATLGGQPHINTIGLNGDNVPMTLYDDGRTGYINLADNWNLDINAIPDYVRDIRIFGAGAVFSTLNPNYNQASTYTGMSGLGFGDLANSINSIMFTNMPYFSFVNIIFALMYMIGLYLMVATK